MKPSLTSPYVLAFAELMEAKLDANRHKGNREGWMTDHPHALLKRLLEEVEELRAAIVFWQTKGWNEASAANEAADVANFAMMIADVVGGLNPKEIP